jgi:hypothetical protein
MFSAKLGGGATGGGATTPALVAVAAKLSFSCFQKATSPPYAVRALTWSGAACRLRSKHRQLIRLIPCPRDYFDEGDHVEGGHRDMPAEAGIQGFSLACSVSAVDQAGNT